TTLVPNDDNEKADTVLFKFLDNNKQIEHTALKDKIEGGSFSSPVEKDPDSEWSTFKSKEETDKSSDYKGYELHIKTTKARGIKMENYNDYSKKCDNVKTDAYANEW
ncbi:hypothetical protein, partial [Staphylococcus gallinarum]|uniref:hypothetical protein n=1 Tax=Staphylococcus gallinarum TaxID=1293 RepID=UPI000EE449B3